MSYYNGFVRVMKDGVPCRMPVWYRDMTAEGKRMIGQGRAMSAPYGRYMSFKREPVE